MPDGANTTIIPGAVTGVCASACCYDLSGVCSVCKRLDPDEYIVVRLPSKETAEADRAVEAFRTVAAEYGLDIPIEVRRG